MMVETYRGTVYPWHCDHMGHMNVQHYAARFDEATWQLFNMLTLTPDYLRSSNRGMAAVEQKTFFKKELLPGDVITIFSQVVELKRKSIRFRHVMKKSDSGEIAAETEFTGIHMNTVLRKSCEFDQEVMTHVMRITESQRRTSLVPR